jgi:hypothetical protein
MLKKLSLAALIAMGSVSFATATPLTDAIKNVNFGGYLRLRVYNDDSSDKSAENRFRTTALFKFSIPVSEELKFNTAYAFDWSIKSDGTKINEVTGDTTKAAAPAPGNVKFFLQYSANGLTALVGKIPVPTPVTATGVGEATAAGAIALYKVNDNITVAAAGLDATVGLDLAGLPINGDKKTIGTGKNIYAAAVMFTKDNIKAEAWYLNVKDAIDSDIVLRADFKVNENIALHADYAMAELDDKNVVTTLDVNSSNFSSAQAIDPSKTQTYYNVSATYKQDQICAKVGYVATGKDGGTVALDADSPLANVLPTEQKTGIANTTDDNAVYAKLGYQVDAKTNVFVAYSDADKSFDNEILVGAKYAYTKKMKVYAYYSILNNEGSNPDNNEARVEFKYSF